jgi:hypothetical protein
LSSHFSTVDEERVGGLDGGGGFDDEEEGLMRKRRVE